MLAEMHTSMATGN